MLIIQELSSNKIITLLKIVDKKMPYISNELMCEI
jgi:hypothetical protein